MAAPTYRLDAILQLENEIAYIERGSPTNAAKVAQRVSDAVAMIGRNPRIGHERDDLQPPGLRIWTVKKTPVTLLYRIEDDDAVVIVLIAGRGQLLQALIDEYGV